MIWKRPDAPLGLYALGLRPDSHRATLIAPDPYAPKISLIIPEIPPATGAGDVTGGAVGCGAGVVTGGDVTGVPPGCAGFTFGFITATCNVIATGNVVRVPAEWPCIKVHTVLLTQKISLDANVCVICVVSKRPTKSIPRTAPILNFVALLLRLSCCRYFRMYLCLCTV